MIRRLEVRYEEEGQAPKVEFEGMWSRADIDRTYNTIIKALRFYKADLIKKMTQQTNEKEEVSDGRRKRK